MSCPRSLLALPASPGRGMTQQDGRELPPTHYPTLLPDAERGGIQGALSGGWSVHQLRSISSLRLKDLDLLRGHLLV